MVLELTQKEKDMAITGIVFSTSKPNLLFVQEGLEGGRYVCEASWQTDSYITVVIYDMELESDTQLISLSGKEIKALKFDYKYDESRGRYGDMIYSFILNHKGLVELEENHRDLYHAISEAWQTWPNQPADIIAKKLFIEVLTFYIREKEQNRNNYTEIF